jgi:hypothetical protein
MAISSALAAFIPRLLDGSVHSKKQGTTSNGDTSYDDCPIPIVVDNARSHHKRKKKRRKKPFFYRSQSMPDTPNHGETDRTKEFHQVYVQDMVRVIESPVLFTSPNSSESLSASFCRWRNLIAHDIPTLVPSPPLRTTDSTCNDQAMLSQEMRISPHLDVNLAMVSPRNHKFKLEKRPTTVSNQTSSINKLVLTTSSYRPKISFRLPPLPYKVEKK